MVTGTVRLKKIYPYFSKSYFAIAIDLKISVSISGSLACTSERVAA